MRYTKHYSARQTPQSQPIPGREAEMAPNEAGGFVFPVDDWTRLARFLVLGSEGGTYYIGEAKLTVENAQAVARCIAADGPRVVRTTVEVSDQGRAPKNDPAIFVLAMCAGLGNDETKKLALAALPKIARIGTHLLHFADYVQHFRGWGRGLRRAVGAWFLERPVENLANQAIKYKSRDGWALRDLLRLTHPVTEDSTRNAIFSYITTGVAAEGVPSQIVASEQLTSLLALTPKGRREAAQLIIENRLPREVVPTELLGFPEIWEALLENMPITAMLRNLGKMSAINFLSPGSEASRFIAGRIMNEELLKNGRVHPLQVLTPMFIYSQGKGDKGSLTWTPVRQVVDALDGAFYMAFRNVEPTNKRIVLGLDASGSMRHARVAGLSFLGPYQACAALALVTANTEQDWHAVAFDTHYYPLSISPRQRLDDVIKAVSSVGGGGTDCALPIQWALENKVSADAFVIYTDSETWQGRVHPVQAIAAYRQATGIPAKLVVVAMCANRSSLADPNDAGMLNVVGLDTSVPNLISDFVRG